MHFLGWPHDCSVPDKIKRNKTCLLNTKNTLGRKVMFFIHDIVVNQISSEI